MESSVPVPIQSLAGFKRVALKAGETKKVDFIIKPEQFSVLNSSYKRVIEPGGFLISVGGSLPDAEGIKAGKFLQFEMNMTGTVFEIKE